MPTLNNYKTYFIDISYLKNFYQMYIECHVMPKDKYGHVYNLPTTIKEDLEIVLDYFNGRWTDSDLERYAINTPYEVLGDASIDERLDFLYQLHKEVENMVRVIKPEYVPNRGVYVWFDHKYLIIVERIGGTYVPDHLCDTFGLSDNQSISQYVQESEGTYRSYSLLHGNG